MSIAFCRHLHLEHLSWAWVRMSFAKVDGVLANTQLHELAAARAFQALPAWLSKCIDIVGTFHSE